MKRLFWSAGMVTLAVAFALPLTPDDAVAFRICEEVECTRPIQCSVACNTCTAEWPYSGECAVEY